jgi:plasmid stabilization system protein ParE
VTFDVVITREAAREVEQRYHALAERSNVSADRWRANLLKTIESLRRTPERCPLAPESEWYGDTLRETYFGKRLHTYRVLFEIRGTAVYILRVRHGLQDFLRETDLPPPDLG